ncbi:MAG: TRAP transporter substrate-binding protein DctP [SAR324 cluster bacterium]|nr:TRAP transporter substrate-binding protein DctP [SAR324 cluster bacterium]
MKNSKNKYYSILFIFLVSILVSGLINPLMAKTFKKRKLVYTSFMSDKTLGAQADIAFWNYVTEKTGGAITVDWKFNGSLNSKSEQQSTVIETGIADMGQWSAAYNPAKFPLGGIAQPLFITDKPDLTSRGGYHIWDNYPEWKEEMTKNNLWLLTSYGVGPVQVAGTTGVIQRMEDIAGKKYRATAFLGEAWAGLGGVPVNVAGSEIYTAVSQGTVEGVILALQHLDLFKIHEHATFVLGGTGFGIYSNSCSVMNLDTWNSLEPGVQKIIIDAREASISNFAQAASTKDQKFYDKFKKAGVKMIKMTPNEKQKLKDRLLPNYWEKIKTKQNKFNPSFGKLMDIYAKKVDEWDKAGVSQYKDPFDN